MKWFVTKYDGILLNPIKKEKCAVYELIMKGKMKRVLSRLTSCSFCPPSFSNLTRTLRVSFFAYILDVTVISSYLKHRKYKQFLELGNCANNISRFYFRSRYDDNDIQSSLFAIVLKIIDNLSNKLDASERENYVQMRELILKLSYFFKKATVLTNFCFQ